MNEMQHQPAMGLQTQEEKQMGMFLHLSQLINVVIPMGGVIAPIILWQVKKEEMPALDAHGKVVVNWIISSFIYMIISAVLTIVLIGFLTLLGVALLTVIFPIIGAVKANNGEPFQYPLCIRLLK